MAKPTNSWYAFGCLDSGIATNWSLLQNTVLGHIPAIPLYKISIEFRGNRQANHMLYGIPVRIIVSQFINTFNSMKYTTNLPIIPTAASHIFKPTATVIQFQLNIFLLTAAYCH